MVSQLQRDSRSSYFHTECTNCGIVSDDDLRDMLSLVEQIDKLEQPMKTIVPNINRNEETFAKFTQFCSSHGVDLSLIDILKKEGDEYGVRAVKDIKEDQVILKIPKSLILAVNDYMKQLNSSPHKSESDRSFIEFITTDPILIEMPSVVLAMILLKEATDSNSFWQPYINILPECYKTPLYFTLDEFKQVKCSSIYEESTRILRSILRQYSYFWTQMQSPKSPASRISFKKNFTFQLYRWAVSTVMTRQNVLPAFQCDGDDTKARLSDSHALIPLWDMFNHRNGKLSTDFENEQNCLICYSMSNFYKDDEIFIHYGNRANRDFFLHNGFVDVENDHDFVSLRLGISRSDPLAAQKIQLCNKLQIPSSGIFCLAKKQSSNGHLIAFLRVFHLSQGKLTKLTFFSVH